MKSPNNNKFIDYFSDTNTGISKEMRTIMMNAEVGNEVAAEDPTVNKLLQKVCILLGKEAAIFLPSGTMANVVAYKTHQKTLGEYIILDKYAHSLVAHPSLLSSIVGATPYPINSINKQRGIFSAKDIENIVTAPFKFNTPLVSCISIEQITNFAGGAIWPLEAIENIHKLATCHNIPIHLDGARLFNASAASSIPVKSYAALCDSVYIDFTKSLGCPMGAVLAGNKKFIQRAWYFKFLLGGGMHQVGMLAAACIYALEHNTGRLIEDHNKVALLAKQLSEIEQIEIEPSLYQANILYFSIKKHLNITAQEFCTKLLAHNIRMWAFNNKIRVITHSATRTEDICRTIEVIKSIFAT